MPHDDGALATPHPLDRWALGARAVSCLRLPDFVMATIVTGRESSMLDTGPCCLTWSVAEVAGPHFAFDKSDLTPEGRAKVRGAAATLNKYPVS